MIGVELRTPELADAVAQLCFRRGLLVLECGKKAIRFAASPAASPRRRRRRRPQVFTQACTTSRETRGRDRDPAGSDATATATAA